ncbi:MAG UNVERIFIED_CONTAM: hypothetical protein LVR18_02535 [Planctomycetaceae bacterium]
MTGSDNPDVFGGSLNYGESFTESELSISRGDSGRQRFRNSSVDPRRIASPTPTRPAATLPG